MSEMAVAYERHRITLEEYHRMVDAGVFNEDARIELIRGELIAMPPIGLPHVWATDEILAILFAKLGGKARIRCQNPITLPDDDSEPQPDLSIARADPRRYLDHAPYPKDLLLVIEIADSSRGYDRRTKMPLYGRAGIPEAWLVDLVERVVRVYREPTAKGYASEQVFAEGESMSPIAFPEERFAVGDLLPPQ